MNKNVNALNHKKHHGKLIGDLASIVNNGGALKWPVLAPVAIVLSGLLLLCLSMAASAQTENRENNEEQLDQVGDELENGFEDDEFEEDAPAEEESDDFVLNYRNVDIRLFVESISELSGKSFLIDPRVGGKVTIIGNATVPQEEIYDVMLSIFTMYGLRAVPGEYDITRIVPGKIAPRYSPLGGRADLITEIIPVMYLQAPSMVPLIKPFMTPEAQIIPHKPTNQLIITEVRTNMEYAKQIMSRIDVPDVGEFEIIDLDNMKAKDMVGLINRAGNKHMKGLVQLVADNKNERIIMTGPRNARLPLRALVVEIDSSRNVVDPVSSLRVIPLEYAKVTDVEKIVKGVLSASNFLRIYGGEGAYIEGGPAITVIEEPSEAAAEGGQQQEEQQKIDTRIDQTKRNFTIQSDRATNSLIVGGPDHILTLVTSLVKSLDVARPQVLIEAIITELSANQTEKLGVEISNAGGLTFGPDNFRGLVGAFTGGNSFRGGYIKKEGDNPFHVLVEAIETDENTRILATPSVVTLNNEKATINIAEEISVLESDFDTAAVNNRRNYRRTEFGKKLTVTPQVTANDNVRLDIDQKISDVVGGEATLPRSSKKELTTNVVVKDGSILVLGGLTETRQDENLGRIPLLANIPLLGFLFRSTSDDSKKTNLMIFIKPTIIKTPVDANEITEEQYASLRLEQIRQLQLESQKGKNVKEGYVLLPALSELGIQLKSDEDGKESEADKPVRRYRKAKPAVN